MLKLSIMVPRRADLTLEEFRAHWKDIHGPLFSSQPEVIQYVRKYIQVHSTGQSLDQFPVAPFDGVAEIWFDKMEDINKVFGTENYLKTIAPDEAKFIDRDKILWIYGDENVVMG
ncbi:EthD domain-containing protein [Mucilaginibacter rigui]|uniref:EthD domain-containing protein n=1 Tax=Mucilaginibacter rigui TaxID=534635 RepID=A0ABR7X5S5_9SPHI|nr:EthD domain-containing protein [Mucilaginibacter rigui]MBD1385932.1 EthD domain-containing protein [Mucilaginibacter rigui]